MDQINITPLPVETQHYHVQSQRKRRSMTPPKDTTHKRDRTPLKTNPIPNKFSSLNTNETTTPVSKFQIGSFQSISSYNEFNNEDNISQAGPSFIPINNKYYQTGPPSTFMETLPSDF
ncbi:hypothetical protein C1645_836063 [Glomus cerebriforme]|uniref:Uncharacterized protein n=1 Tax=Glomus cerebriforme TaxID=658196 RepID=A0A397SGT5_9GLOM|nr:hypothetical protein C1645_836063 [Glomus cerebriforme]